MKDFLNIELKVKHVIIIFIILSLTAFVPPKLAQMIKAHDKSVWAITYYKDRHEVEIKDYYSPHVKIIVTESEGLMFIRNIMIEDSSKIKSFKIK